MCQCLQYIAKGLKAPSTPDRARKFTGFDLTRARVHSINSAEPYLVYHRRCTSHYHTPLVRYSKLDSSTTKRVPIPNDTSTSPEISRRDVSNADLFGTDTVAAAVEISTIGTPTQGGLV